MNAGRLWAGHNSPDHYKRFDGVLDVLRTLTDDEIDQRYRECESIDHLPLSNCGSATVRQGD